VAAPPVPQACTQVTTATVGTGVLVSVYAAPGSSQACAVLWHQGSWTFEVEGAIARAAITSSSSSPLVDGNPGNPCSSRLPSRSTARRCLVCRVCSSSTSLLTALHTLVRRHRGAATYAIGVDYEAAPAILLAAAMHPYPLSSAP